MIVRGRLRAVMPWLCAAIMCLGKSALLEAARPQEFVRLISVRDDDPATDDRGRARVNINAVSYKTNSLTTVGDYQFTSYYGGDGKLIVGRRHLLQKDSAWTLSRTEFTSFNIEDSHNTSSIAIDGDAYLHIAWGVHGNPLLYTRTTAPVVNDDPIRLVGGSVGNAACIADALPFQSERTTYPEFFNIPDSGDLFLTFRIGSAGNGEWQLVRWNNESKIWIGVHAAVNSGDEGPQPWIDNDFSGDDLPNVNAYHNKIVFDQSGRMHVSWTWRTGADSKSGFNDYQTNHNLMYAFSDNCGVDWHRSDGKRYQRNGVHDIDENNAAPVVLIPEGSSLRNQTSATIGPDGHYYVGCTWAPRADEGNHLREYMLVEYDGTSWKTHQVGARRPEFDNKRMPERRLNDFSKRRPIVLADNDNRVFVVFSDYQRGGGVTIAYSENEARDDWQFIDLTSHNMGRWDPTYDLKRWQRDGILSVLYLPGGSVAEIVSVLEWDARSFFNQRAASATQLNTVVSPESTTTGE